MAAQPNIVFVCVDQWRADCLSAAGHPTVETPHLDRLAAQGTSFERAYSATPTCVPARAAILTGLAPRHHGFVGYNDRVDWNYDATLPGLLADAGYHTQCVGKMHVHPARHLAGFHNVVLHDGYLHRERGKRDDPGLSDDYTPWLRQKMGQPEVDHVDSGIGCNGYAARPWPYDEALHPTTWVTTQGIDFLRRRDPGKPFFLMLSYHRPHPPLDPPPYYLDHYRHKELPPLVRGDWVEHQLPPGGHDSPVPHDPAQIDLARRAYYAQISHIDHQFNRFVMALFENGVWDNTAVIFTSDHGEMLYDHNHIAKAVPFEGSARVPFILRLPQGRARARESVQNVIELRDILPTCCDLAGAEIPDFIDGRSLLPLCEDSGQDQTDGWRPHLHGEHFSGPGSTQWLTDGREKYVWYPQSGRELLFNLPEDPDECHDLSVTRPERLAHWRGLLVKELEGREEGFVDGNDLVVGRPQGPTLERAGERLAR